MSDTTRIYWPEVTAATFPTRLTLGFNIPTPPLSIDKDEWLRRSQQVGKRHPLGPDSVCLSCGNFHLGYWKWEAWEPDEHCICGREGCEGTHQRCNVCGGVRFEGHICAKLQEKTRDE